MAMTKQVLYGSQLLGGSIDTIWDVDMLSLAIRRVAGRVLNIDAFMVSRLIR